MPVMAFGIDDAINAGLQIVNKFIPDPNQRAEAEASLRQSLQQWDQQQSETNTAEAQNPSLFVSGWRPAIGWIGASGLAYQYVVRPLAYGAGWHDLPALDSTLMELVFAMLGMGGLRTYEKIKGVASK
jgi:Holin of 3TMs, for gene-transfer release